MNPLNQQSLVETFTDTKMHEAVAEIIYSHSTNKLDVRTAALNGLQLQDAKTILDLGCGFGFFTRSIKGRINQKAKILGIDKCSNYNDPYLKSCDIAGLDGDFIGAGADYLEDLPSNSYDLIICSYALYFFPDIISQIARILNNDGMFITITHSSNHLFELFSFVKNTYNKQKNKITEYLPYEELIRNFNNENGNKLLSSYFGLVKEKDYCSALIFEKDDDENLKKYLEFKRPFYVPDFSENIIYDSIIESLCSNLRSGNSFKITKDDTIYICFKPLLKD